ncbi:MAG TPA: dockerin type I repeat-containing protein, partial [Acidobacteriota bacterium]|nr:dockerin type I repeat-containing protein [Acidobacteriota bacterium]
MTFKRSILFAVAAIICLSGAASAQIDPFVRLDFGVNPDCPYDCDPVFLVVTGELSSSSWLPPDVLGWTRDGDQIAVEMRVMYDPDASLPVTVPFDIEVPIGTLPEGAYEVTWTIWVDNPIATMPSIPIVVGDQHFRVAPPGDQNCDGVINIVDVVWIIRPVFRSVIPPDPVAMRRADVDCNGIINVLDVVQLIYYVFRNGAICDPCDMIEPVPYVEITNLPLDELRGDGAVLEDVSVLGDTITIVLSHSGGCLTHGYHLFAPLTFSESDPPGTWVYPQHLDPGDLCDAWVTETLRYNL